MQLFAQIHWVGRLRVDAEILSMVVVFYDGIDFPGRRRRAPNSVLPIERRDNGPQVSYSVGLEGC